jgi:choline dehydrogenase-like flavoprotein
MIVDINELGPVDVQSADVCIVGSGAVGITMAREFIGTTHSIILLEGGGQAFESRSQEPYRSEIAGLHHDGVHNGRVRVVGGTTTLWAGQSLPLWDMDFQRRDWVANSGWPLDKRTLRPFYRRAEEVLQIPHATYEAADLPDRGDSLPAYQGDAIVTYFSQFAATPNFAQMYRARLKAAKNVTLLTHANAVALEATPDATSIRQLLVRSFQGKELRIRAKMFVICCGGIESARLLLASDSVEPNGIGNRHDMVGRFFQDHPGVAIPVRPLDHKRFSQWYGSFRKGDIRHCIKYAASETLQREKGILHVGGEVFYPISFAVTAAKLFAGAFSQMFRKKRETTEAQDDPNAVQPASQTRMFNALATVAQRLDQVGKTAFFRRYVLGKVVSLAALQPHVGFSVEQEPNPFSRVTLSREIDSLGMRRTVLDWRLTKSEGRSIAIFAQALSDEWRKLGLAEFDPDDLQIAGREQGEHGGFIDASHHMGTTRMGADPTTSVVDPSCRVHGYANLYIGSSSVFPTSGFSNPTLTTLALCLRICDEIKTKLSNSVMAVA